MPHYDFKTHARMDTYTPVGDVDVVIVEGILIFAHDELMCVRALPHMYRPHCATVHRHNGRSQRVLHLEALVSPTHDPLPPYRRLFDMRLFALEDADTCLARRLRRDIVERGRSVESVLQQYEDFVKPAFSAYVEHAFCG